MVESTRFAKTRSRLSPSPGNRSIRLETKSILQIELIPHSEPKRIKTQRAVVRTTRAPERTGLGYFRSSSLTRSCPASEHRRKARLWH